MPVGFPGGGNFGRSGAQSGFGQLLGYGGGEPNMDYDQINALLQHFGGLSVSPDYKPQGVFENMPWISKRAPALAGGLDNALIALSNMGPTGSTAGENISNVARGLQSIGPTRQAQAMAPTLMALQMAQGVAGLQQSAANINREGAMAEYYSGRNDASNYTADQRRNAALIRGQFQAASAQHGPQVITGKNGKQMVGVPSLDDDGNLKYEEHPEIDVNEFRKQQTHQKLASAFGGGTEGAIIGGMLSSGLGPDGTPESYTRRNPMLGKPGAKGPDAFWADANNILLQHRTAAAGVNQGGAAQRQQTGLWATNQRDAFKNIYQNPGTAGIREKRIDARSQEIFMAPGFSGTRSDAKRQAQNEAQAHQSKLQDLWGQYSLLDEDAQQKAGGITGYLGQQGYDARTDTFQNRSGAQANPSNLSPAQQQLLDLLKK